MSIAYAPQGSKIPRTQFVQSWTLSQHTKDIVSYIVKHFTSYNQDTFLKEVVNYIKYWLMKNNITVNNQEISDFIMKNYAEIESKVKKQCKIIEDELEMHRRDEYNYAIKRAKEDLFAKVHKNKTKTSFQQACLLKSFQPLLNEDRRRIYDEYERLWDEAHPKEDITRIRYDTFTDRLNKFVVEHTDELLSLDEFIKVTSGWNRGRKSIHEWYEEYKNKFFHQPGTTITYDESPLTGFIGFKSKDKVKAIKSLQPQLKELHPEVKASFPLKQNIKQFQLHKVASRYTYVIDLMFIDKLVYLVAINVNTKYLYVELINDEISEGKFSKRNTKSTISYLKALQKMIDGGRQSPLQSPMIVRHLTM